MNWTKLQFSVLETILFSGLNFCQWALRDISDMTIPPLAFICVLVHVRQTQEQKATDRRTSSELGQHPIIVTIAKNASLQEYLSLIECLSPGRSING